MEQTTKRGQQRCPSCHESIVPLPIVYGYPAAELFEEAEAGRVQLGGCVVTEDDPKWACPSCDAPLFDDAERE